jgi:TATA-box binding protein (TBP) (component of TFIID and TFIIIB)
MESAKEAKDVNVKIVNVVATCKLPFRVNLEALAAKLPDNVKLNSRYPKYRCAYLKVEGMGSIVTVFSSGAMISVGSRSVKDAEKDLTIAYNVILSYTEHLNRADTNPADNSVTSAQRKRRSSKDDQI